MAATAAQGTHAQAVASATAQNAPPVDSPLDHWWLGGYYRHLWVPDYIVKPFLERAPSVTEDGWGVVATYHSSGGLNVEMGLGYMPYGFYGPFRGKDSQLTDTELVRSNLGFYHVTSSLMWDIEFHRTVALEIGFGLDIGVLSGDVRRNEAYLDGDRFANCKGPLSPPTLGPSVNGEAPVAYCAAPGTTGGSGTYDPATGAFVSDKANEKGEQYNVRDNHVPPVMLFPMVPHLALRLKPFKHLMLKAELGFGVVQIWAGVSLHVSFGLVKTGPKEVFVKSEEPAPVTGRVLGRVVEADTNAPIAGATVRLKAARALSPLTTETDGRFMIDRLDVGHLHFDVEHPDYSAGQCEADIPATGGDVPLECHLTQKARVGAISGQVESEDGKQVATPSVELTGPRNDKLAGDDRGLFAAVDLPAGSYRIRVEADGYLMQVVEVEVEPHQTAMPQIILIKKPKHTVVELRKEEIVITEQIQFKPGSAEIRGESEGVLRQVADVILRNPQIEMLEVQGHTDGKGGHDMNMQLSQSRAESVRDWLLRAGVAGERLEAKGYGPDHPIRPNDTADNRAKNRRVQFILRKQADAAAPAQE